MALNWTVRGIKYTEGQRFTARTGGTWYGSADGGAGSGSIASGKLVEFYGDYTGTAEWYYHPYLIRSADDSFDGGEKCWTDIDIFPYATYTVKYNANGGSGAPSNQTKTWNTTLKLSSTVPTRSGYQFQGWATSASGSVAYASGANYTANAGITLYAVWKDITAPTITLNAPTNIEANSLTISASSNVTCKTWQYQLNGGSWVTFNSGNATSVTHKITGLTPATPYSIKVRATKVSNSVVGTSAAKSATTLGGMVLTSTQALQADTSNVLKFNATFYNASYTNKLTLKDGATTILSEFSIGTHAIGNNVAVSATLTSAQITAIQNAMSASKSKTFKLYCASYNGSTLIGGSNSMDITITISSASAPALTISGYEDSNTATKAITGNNQILIQDHSTLKVNGISVTLKNGATFGSLKFQVGNVTKTSSSNVSTYTFGTVGSSKLTVTLTDSRGYTATAELNLTLWNYSPVKISSASVKRVNSVEADTRLIISGTFTALSGNNSLQVTNIKVGNEVVPFVPTVSGGSFSFNGIVGSYDVDTKFDCIITISDKLTTVTLGIALPKGIPVVQILDGKVIVHDELNLYDGDSDTYIDMTIGISDWSDLDDWFDAN